MKDQYYVGFTISTFFWQYIMTISEGLKHMALERSITPFSGSKYFK